MINACVQILFTSCGSFIKGTSEWVLMYFIIHNKRSSEDVLQRCQQFRVGARRPGFSPPIYIPLYTSTRISRVLFVDHSWPPPSHLFSSLFLPVRSGHHGASPGIGSFFLWPAEWLRGIRLWSSAYFFCIGEFLHVGKYLLSCIGLSLNFSRLRRVTCRPRYGGGYVGALPTDFASRLVVVDNIANLVRTRETRCPGARLQHTDTDLHRTTLAIIPVAPRINMHGYEAGYLHPPM